MNGGEEREEKGRGEEGKREEEKGKKWKGKKRNGKKRTLVERSRGSTKDFSQKSLQLGDGSQSLSITNGLPEKAEE